MSNSTESYFPTVYNQLRVIASHCLSLERPDISLSATDLVHESFVRLTSGCRKGWESDGHFFAAVARSMRKLLIEKARARNALKRRRQGLSIDLNNLMDLNNEYWELMLDLDDALHRLAQDDQLAANLVSQRVFSGLNVTEAGRQLGLSKCASYDIWKFAVAWFASLA
ncbi:MAG: RNA polymerase subunit sigma [Planctomycetales bacterium]|nr:RNA polymerase subunit sigma [Planctomycetales bacterium]